MNVDDLAADVAGFRVPANVVTDLNLVAMIRHSGDWLLRQGKYFHSMHCSTLGDYPVFRGDALGGGQYEHPTIDMRFRPGAGSAGR